MLNSVPKESTQPEAPTVTADSQGLLQGLNQDFVDAIKACDEFKQFPQFFSYASGLESLIRGNSQLFQINRKMALEAMGELIKDRKDKKQVIKEKEQVIKEKEQVIKEKEQVIQKNEKLIGIFLKFQQFKMAKQIINDQ